MEERIIRTVNTNAYSSIGKNSNFICSQMDSLTGVKYPTIEA